MKKKYKGTIHGQSILIEQEIGLPEGLRVEVTINVFPKADANEPWGEGLKRAAGAFADVPEFEEDMKQILEERKTARFREVLE